ncbi:MAG: GntR family transcriptional regulator [bacterium]
MNIMQNNPAELSKKKQIYEYLKQEIIFNRLEPGTVLVERQICNALDVSRTPVREAIQQLVSESLATNLTNKGSVVSTITYENIACVYEVREYLEGLAARLSAQRISETGIKELHDYLLVMERNLKVNNHNDLFAADYNFHECIIKSANNDILLATWKNLQSQVLRITRLIDKNAAGIMNSHKLHTQIFESIEKHDCNAAESFMREHIRNSKINQLKLFAPNIVDSTI